MSSPNITFDSIPSSIRKPGKYFEYNTKLAVRTLPNNLQRMLIIGEKLSGTGLALTPVRIFSDAEAIAHFGSTSELARMCSAAIKANPYLDLSAVCTVPAVAGTPRFTNEVIFSSPTGTASDSGTITLTVGGIAFPVTITSDQSMAVVAGNMMTALAESTLVTAAYAITSESNPNDTLTITLTDKLLGPYDSPLSCVISGVGSIFLVQSLNCHLGDGVDPAAAITLEEALAAVAADNYQVIVVPDADPTNLAAVRDHLDFVAGPMEQRPGVGVYATTGALADATTLAGELNSGRLCGVYLRGTTTPAEELAAAFGAVLCSEEDPARPLNTLVLHDVSAPPIASRLIRTEQEACLNNGVTPLEVGPGGKVQIVRAISTYTLDASGINDISLLDLTTIRTLDYVRKALRERITLRFPREKLSAKTPPKVRSEILDVLYKLEELEIVENVDINKDGVIVERDSQDPNRLNAKIPTDVVNGLHVFAGRIDLIL